MTEVCADSNKEPRRYRREDPVCTYPWRALLWEECGVRVFTQCGWIVLQQLIISRSQSSHFIAFPVLLINKIHVFSPSWFNRGSLAGSMNIALLRPRWPGRFKRLCQYQRRKSGGCHVRSNTGQCSTLVCLLTTVYCSHLLFNQANAFIPSDTLYRNKTVCRENKRPQDSRVNICLCCPISCK